ncbi:hypothetical protein B0H21DRAFT_51436 [Amylocystis lapponica]|nr:hypothetical protein B0H21DRAFT_51436 [Amylocystis lapponica]
MDSINVHQDPTGPRVIIVGGGIGGITCGIALKKQLGFQRFTIYEKAADFGGTWRDNIYPGCRADSPTHWFSLSTELNPNWTESHVSQAELLAYWKRLTDKYALEDNTVFNTKVVSAAWDTARQLYDIVLEDILTRERTTTIAHIFVSAIGALIDPMYPPGMKGLDTFKGAMFHSAQWDNSIVLQNKRVAVVGVACSASQFIPRIVQDPTVHIVNFARAPAWRVPIEYKRYTTVEKWIFAHVPFAMRIYRNWIMLKSDSVFWVFLWKHNPFRKMVESDLTKLIKETAPEDYHDRLIPTYPFGCKRPVVGTDYLVALHRPNLDLNCDGIAEVVEDGILTETGDRLPFDVIIWATGFVTDRHTVDIKGSKGQTLQEYCGARGGPVAYRSVTVPGFPNFYYLSGPNSVAPHGNAMFRLEVQIDYAIQMMKPVLKGPALSFEVREDVCDAHNEGLQERIRNSGFLECTSYYRAAGNGKNFSICLGSLTAFWWALRRPIWSHYIAVRGTL